MLAFMNNLCVTLRPNKKNEKRFEILSISFTFAPEVTKGCLPRKKGRLRLYPRT